MISYYNSLASWQYKTRGMSHSISAFSHLAQCLASGRETVNRCGKHNLFSGDCRSNFLRVAIWTSGFLIQLYGLLFTPGSIIICWFLDIWVENHKDHKVQKGRMVGTVENSSLETLSRNILIAYSGSIFWSGFQFILTALVLLFLHMNR